MTDALLDKAIRNRLIISFIEHCQICDINMDFLEVVLYHDDEGNLGLTEKIDEIDADKIIKRFRLPAMSPYYPLHYYDHESAKAMFFSMELNTMLRNYATAKKAMASRNPETVRANAKRAINARWHGK